MKKVYVKPILDTKAYAQFENVFADCNKNPAKLCTYDPNYFAGDGNSYSSHESLRRP